MALTEAIEIIVRMPGAISSAARPSTGCTGWWAWTRSPSPFQCRSASSRIDVAVLSPMDRSVDGARDTGAMDDASYEHLVVKRDGDITTVTLDRPEKRNALALDVMEELTATLEAIGATDARGVVLAANGPVFSAGHNFGDMAGAHRSTRPATSSTCAPG